MHKNQVRKIEGTPYILHPMEAASIASGLTDDEEVLVAVLLHDTVEDTPATPEDIKREFGERVAMYVASETENKRENLDPRATWKLRKEESLEVLRTTEDNNVRILWMGDKLSNIRAMYRAYLVKGDDIYENFHQKDPKEHAWYFNTILEYLSPLKGSAAYEEYKNLVNKIFGE